MASRSQERAETAIAEIKKQTGKDVQFLQLDLQDLNNVKECAKKYLQKGVALDCLINNTGIMACPFASSKDGIETQVTRKT